jgi:hypothetical protein
VFLLGHPSTKSKRAEKKNKKPVSEKTATTTGLVVCRLEKKKRVEAPRPLVKPAFIRQLPLLRSVE